MEMAIHGMDFEIDGMFRTNEGLDFFEKWAQNGVFWRPFEVPLDVRRTKSRVYKNRPYLSVAATVKMGGAVRVKKIRLCQFTMDNGGFSMDN